MNWILYIALFIATICPTWATQRFTDHITGASLTLPNGWTLERPTAFGYALIPSEGEKQKRIRIHPSTEVAPDPETAVTEAHQRLAALRRKNNHPAELILSSSPVVAASGLRGHKLIIGYEGQKGHLARIYFQKPDQSYFCTCIYYAGDEAFLRLCEDAILKSLEIR